MFEPDPRNAGRQKVCSNPACQKARQRRSYRRWAQRPENRGYGSGANHVKRVQEWRKANPDYSRRGNRAKSDDALPNALNPQPTDNTIDTGLKRAKTPPVPDVALHNALNEPMRLLVGLILHLSGLTLPKDIEHYLQELLNKVEAVLGPQSVSTLNPSDEHDSKKPAPA